MSCNTYEKLFHEYLNKSLTPTMHTCVEEHLAACDSCRSAMNGLKRLSASLTDLFKKTTRSLLLAPDTDRIVAERALELGFLQPEHELMKLFEHLSFRERWAKILEGLKQPPDSGDYKWAKLQMTRLVSPAAGVVVPILVLCLLALLAGLAPKRARAVNVKIAELEQIEELEEPEDLPEPEIQPPDPEDIVEPTDSFIPSTSKDSVGPDADFSPQPAPFDAVAIIKSPVIMKGIFGNRSPGARGSALGRYGGSGHTEGAVMRALRWLKKHQESDGSWTSQSGADGAAFNNYSQGKPAAMTGIGLLAFLAHGETPASVEFGQTVEGAMKWLVQNQAENGWFTDNRDNGYNHPIATYALCEAYGMTKLPLVKVAAEKALGVILQRQHPLGGWNYVSTAASCQGLSSAPGSRNDVSVTAWCVQALKAAKMAGMTNPGIDKAMEGARNVYTKTLYAGSYFYYNEGRSSFKTLTGTGVLALQLLGMGDAPATKGGLEWCKQNISCAWGNDVPAPIYNWYYVTQARFHAGGETWKEWNKQFAPALVKNQNVIAKAIKAPSGKMVDIGYWKYPGQGHDNNSYMYTTGMCALMLQVYYRYLPTFKSPEQIMADQQEAAAAAPEANAIEAKDLEIEIEM